MLRDPTNRNSSLWANSTEDGNKTWNQTEYVNQWLYYRATSYMELILMTMFLIAWFISIYCFFSRWNTVRLMQPVGTRYCYMPKGLDTIRVVKDAADSVIYCR